VAQDGPVPEGDTVWNTAQLLHRALAGARLTGTQFRLPTLATTDLVGWSVRESASRGKHLLLRLLGPDGASRLTLHSHLRMDGAWRVFGSGERWSGRPAHLIRVVLRTDTAVAVGYHLHEVALVPSAEEDRLVGSLGPDLLGADWDPAEAVRRLRAHPQLSIAEALLDQANLAGIGNLYKCELLFLRGVAPWTPVGQVVDLPALVDLAHRVLSANRGRWTQSTTGSLRRGQTSYVYGRAGLPCRRCGTLVRSREYAGRITYWCPVCQPDRPDRSYPGRPPRG
jgi:endonuclease-8